MVYFLFGKLLSPLWRICYIIGLIFIIPNRQILKNNLTIWSHWSPHEENLETCFLLRSEIVSVAKLLSLSLKMLPEARSILMRLDLETLQTLHYLHRPDT